MILGFAAAALLLLTAAKFITRRLPFRRLDGVFLKIHKVCGTALILVTAAHLALAWRLLRQRPAGMVILGFALLVCMLAAALSHVFRKTLGRKWLRLHRAATVLILVCLALHMALGVSSFNAYQKAIAGIRISDIDVREAADGEYEGAFDAGYIYARVAVTVEDGKITGIDLLEHRNERGKPAEKIVDDILSQQTLNVDTVSGATNSSLVIKKAVENALAQAVK